MYSVCRLPKRCANCSPQASEVTRLSLDRQAQIHASPNSNRSQEPLLLRTLRLPCISARCRPAENHLSDHVVSMPDVEDGGELYSVLSVDVRKPGGGSTFD